MDIDKEKIKQRISEINEAVAEIQKIVSQRDEEFWSKKENMAAVKYYLLQAIEAAGNICVHIAARKLNKGVSVFGECFEILWKEGILSENLVSRLRKMVKFRNKLVHRYWEIEDENILRYTREDLKDFYDFMKELEKKL